MENAPYIPEIPACMHATKEQLGEENDRLRRMIASLESDIAEQCRLHGIGSEREARKDARIAELERKRDQMLAALRSVASIAHCGGLAGMTESEALTAIRRFTIPHFTREATEEQHRAAIAAAISSVKGGA